MGFIIFAIVLILVAAVLLWGLGKLPMDPTLFNIIRVLVICAIAIWLIVQLYQRYGKGI